MLDVDGGDESGGNERGGSEGLLELLLSIRRLLYLAIGIVVDLMDDEDAMDASEEACRTFLV